MSPSVPVAAVAAGRERHGAADRLPRHRHRDGYAALVLSGGYLEAGDAGRFSVAAGDVLIHRAFEAHLDRFNPGGAEVLNLPLRSDAGLPDAGRVRDPDMIVRLAERDLRAALACLTDEMNALAPVLVDWPDRLAAALREQPALRLDAWASEHRLAPATVARGFQSAFGVTPSHYRAEVRARRAWRLVLASSTPLADIAAEQGFADQAHMTRAITALTGAPPGRWRRGLEPARHR